MGLLDKIFSSGAKAVVDTVSNVVDRFVTTPDEKAAMKAELEKELNRHMEALAAQAIDIEKTYLADVADARGANARIQEAAGASWMSKNIAYIIDILVTVAWVGLTAYLIVVMLNLVNRDKNVDYTAVTAVWGAVTGVFTQVLSFHRGSSRGSEDKQKTIDKMMVNPGLK